MMKATSTLFVAVFSILSSFALAFSQSDVNGGYIHKHAVDVYDPDKQEWSSYETTDKLFLKNINEQSLRFCFELYFSNGHRCLMEDDARKVGKNRYEYLEQDPESKAVGCRLHIHIGKSMIKLEDIDAMCREKYCGARGVIDGVEFNLSSNASEDLECGFKN